MKTYTKTRQCLNLSILGLLLAVQGLIGQQSVVVNLAAPQFPGYSWVSASQNASGFLHSVSATEPTAEYFESLKPQILRFRAAIGGVGSWGAGTGFESPDFMRRISTIPHRQIVLSDEYMGSGYHNSLGWPSAGNPAALNKLSETITAIHNKSVSQNAAGHTGYTGYEWDIWNEPDYYTSAGNYFWGGSLAQFLNCWDFSYDKIKALQGVNAVIVGPSISSFNFVYLQNFLLHCKSVNKYPTYLSWHEIQGLAAADIYNHASAIRSWMVANQIPLLPIMINEYTAENEATKPGLLPWYFSSLEAARFHGVVASARSCWDEIPGNGASNTLFSGRLDGIMTASSPHSPRASWWLYKGYADMNGKMVSVTGSSNVNGVASVSSAGGCRVVLGNNSNTNLGTVLVTITGLNQIPFYNKFGKIHFYQNRIRGNTGSASVLTRDVYYNANYSGAGNALTFSLEFNAYDAYVLSFTNPRHDPLADNNADGIAELAIWTPSTGIWHMYNKFNGWGGAHYVAVRIERE